MKLIDGAVASVAPVVPILGGVRATVWFALMVVFFAFGGVQSCRLHSAQTKQSLLSNANDLWQQADQNNRKAIADFQRANSAWAARAAANKQANADALASLAKINTGLSKDLLAKQQALEKLYAKYPAVKKWAATGAPAAVSDVLYDGLPKDKNRNR